MLSLLPVLIAARGANEGRRYTIKMIVAASGASRSAVEKLLNNTMQRIPAHDVALLCRWLGVGVGDILTLRPPEGGVALD